MADCITKARCMYGAPFVAGVTGELDHADLNAGGFEF